MGRPNASACCDAGEEDPAEPFAALAVFDVGVDMEGSEAGDGADQHCKQDQSIVMLVSKTGKNLKHEAALSLPPFRRNRGSSKGP